ncbi:MAG: hypothetical protein V1817_02940 [Candidatus Micrarchaeota archaeon]
MSELTALLAGGVVAGALFDAYAYYRYKYSQRALEVAQGGVADDAAQKTLAQEIAGENTSESEGDRKPLADRLKEIDEAREQRKARGSGCEDGAVLFEPESIRKENEEIEGARFERVGLREGDSASSEGIESGFTDSIAALRASIADLNSVLKKRSGRSWRSGGVASLGDASEGASFSGVGSSDYAEGDYGVVSG